MWAQNITHSIALAREPRQQVARTRFGGAGGVVLLDLAAQRPQLSRQGVGDLALLSGRAADLAVADEPVEQSLVAHAGEAIRD